MNIMNQKIILTILVLVLLAVGGAVYYTSMQKEQVVQESIKETSADNGDSTIQLLDSTELSKSCITDWKTYRNEKFGYEICFPKTWAVSDDRGIVTVEDTVKKTEEVYGAENYPILYITPEQTSSFDDWIMNNVPEIDAGMVTFEEIADIEINNVRGKELPRIITIGGCERSVALFHEGVVFNIFRYGGTCQYDDDTINNVISSFRIYK